MFARTFSFCRRLVGTEARRGSGTAVEEDRRLWVRDPGNLEATFEPAEPSDQDRLSAEVRDISRGGANLVVERAFQPGDLLSLELPGLADSSRATVLACIVRVRSSAKGKWELGCVFSRELNDDDLQGFG